MGRVSLDSLGGGALLEKVNMDLMQIVENIMDPNTKSEKPRKLTITLTFLPDDSRQVITTKMETKTSLVPIEAAATVMLAGQDIHTGRMELREYGNNHPRYQVVGEAVPVDTGPAGFDPDTGEILDGGEPVDLRKAQ